MRTAYLDTLYKLAGKDDRVISLVSDNGLIVYDDFRRDFPDRYYNFGISEGNMISAAAGMASCGLIPFSYTISAFLAYRSFEFIRDDVCFQNQNVKIVGIGSGTAYSTLGPSHHATEDISVLRVLPNLTLFSPGCATDVKNIIKAAYEIEGPVYIRLGTNKEPEIYDKAYDFQIGKGITVRDGEDISIIATGAIVSDCIEAADNLEKSGISTRIINIHTLKPFDTKIIQQAAKETKALFTVEDHNIYGGLGTLVCEAVAESGISLNIFKRIGLYDCFAKGYGTPKEVKKINSLDSTGIYSTIMSVLKKGEI